MATQRPRIPAKPYKRNKLRHKKINTKRFKETRVTQNDRDETQNTRDEMQNDRSDTWKYDSEGAERNDQNWATKLHLKRYKMRHKYPKGAEIKIAPEWHQN